MSTSPPSSKRRKGGDGSCVVVPGELFKSSNEESVTVTADDDFDDRKPAAKAVSDGQAAVEATDDHGSPRKSFERTKCNNNNDNNKPPLPLAPTLDEYLKSGGHTKYAPRPEWCHFSNESTSSPAAAAGTTPAAMPAYRLMMMDEMTRNDPSSAVAAAAGRRAPLMPVVAAGGPMAVAAAALEEASFLARIQNEVGNDDGMMDNNVQHNNHNNHRGVAIHQDYNIPEDLSNAIHAVTRRAEDRLSRRVNGGAPLLDVPAAAENGQQLQPPLPLAVLANNDNMPLEGGNDHDMALRQVMSDIALGQQRLQQQTRQHRRDLRHRHHNVHPSRRHGNRHGRHHGPIPPGEPIPADGPDGNGPERRAHQQHLMGPGQWFGPPVENPAGQMVDNNPGVANNDLIPLRYQQHLQQHDQQEGRLENPLVARGNMPMIGGPATDPLQSMPVDGVSTAAHHGRSMGSAAFGADLDSALHLAIKQHATEAALDLIRAGACVEFPNAKGITPLMIASQEGTLEVVQSLLNKGALPNATTIRGSTSLIQACHFGKLSVVEELLRHGALVDQANLKNTTALMRASQEGHEDVVRLLLSRNAGVNRRNDERMTALMLSSQRGHARIVSMLVKSGAQVDSKTAQDSTSLMLACKRKHFGVAKILVASGTELKLKDCKNRTVLETATRRGNDEFCKILTDSAQVHLMQEDSRRERNFEMVRVWKLLQLERATIRLGGSVDVTIHSLALSSVMGTTTNTPNNSPMVLMHMCQSKRALVRAMTLPAPLIELISSFIPLPLIWEKRLILLTSRSHIDPDSAVFNALDLIDEVLEVGGILEAFGAAGVAPPSSFESWSTYQLWCGKCDVILSRCSNVDVTNILAQESGTEGNSPENLRLVEPSQTQRRACNYLQVLARAPQSLTTTLSSHPHDMPRTLFEKLKACHDIQSVVRRLAGGGIHFDTIIANDMVVLARMAVMWCESRPMY